MAIIFDHVYIMLFKKNTQCFFKIRLRLHFFRRRFGLVRNLLHLLVDFGYVFSRVCITREKTYPKSTRRWPHVKKRWFLFYFILFFTVANLPFTTPSYCRRYVPMRMSCPSVAIGYTPVSIIFRRHVNAMGASEPALSSFVLHPCNSITSCMAVHRQYNTTQWLYCCTEAEQWNRWLYCCTGIEQLINMFYPVQQYSQWFHCSVFAWNH